MLKAELPTAEADRTDITEKKVVTDAGPDTPITCRGPGFVGEAVISDMCSSDGGFFVMSGCSTVNCKLTGVYTETQLGGKQFATVRSSLTWSSL